VDLDRLGENPADADQVRTQLRLNGRLVMIYVGKLTEPYLDREMADFFAVARRLDPRLAFLVLTQAPPTSMASELVSAGIPESAYRITSADPAAMGGYLAMGEFAICFCRPTFARIASSPTKIGEYLGAGLPVVSGPEIGDGDELLSGRRVGVIVDAFCGRSYETAAREVLQLASDPASRVRCREVAREVYSLQEVGIPRYDRLYRRLAQESGDVRVVAR
jgi:hypothetical protein